MFNQQQLDQKLLKLESSLLDAVNTNDEDSVSILLSYTKENDSSWKYWRYDGTLNHAIHCAVVNKNLKMVNLLLKNGADMNVENREHRTPLMLALENHHGEIISLFFNKSSIETYLLDAIKINNENYVRVLLEYRENEKSSSNDCKSTTTFHHENLSYNTIFMHALENNNAEIIILLCNYDSIFKQLLDECIDENTGNHAMHCAIEKNNIPVVKLLLQNRVNIHCENKKGQTPLTLALEKNNPSILREFLTHNTYDTMTTNKIQSSYRFFLLAQAIIQDDLKTVKNLLNRDNLNEKLLPENLTPLELAIKYGTKTIAEYLLIQGAKLQTLEIKHTEIYTLFTQHAYAESNIDNAVEQANENTKKILAFINTRMSQEIEEKEESEFLTFSQAILVAISEVLKKRQTTNELMSVNEKIDLAILINSLFDAIQTTNKMAQLKDKCKLLLAEREDTILNTKMDYCYAGDSLANQLCFLLAKNIAENEASLSNILLENARTKDRVGTTVSFYVEILTEQELKNSIMKPGYGNFLLVLNKQKSYLKTTLFDGKEITIPYQDFSKYETLKPLVRIIKKLPTVNSVSELTSDQETLQAIKELIRVYHSEMPTQWFDSMMGIEETALPECKDLFRLSGNEIHLYQPAIMMAITRIKEHNNLLEHIWFGTDPKNTTPVPPLSPKNLALLKQRSPTLQRLIEYTEQLDRQTRELAESNVYLQFELLQKGLLAGNYNSKDGSHMNAGAAAIAAIAAFADWWHRLNARRPDLCKQIRSFTDSRNECFGEVIDILFDQTNVTNNQRRDNAIYCVHLKANMLERLLGDEKISNALRDIKLTMESDCKVEPVSDEVLDQWGSNILEEIQTQPFKPIFVNDCGKFPHKIPLLELNSLLINRGVIKHYHDMYLGKDRKEDSKFLITYILSETDNNSLIKLRDILSNNEFNYLRLHVNNSKYFTFFEGQEVRTSKNYALIHKALANQMMLNATRDKTTKEDARAAARVLCEQNTFIKIKTKNRFGKHLSGPSKVSILFENRKKLKTNQIALTNKISRLKKRTMKL